MDTGDTSLHCYLLASHAAHKAATSHRQPQWYFLAIQFLVGKHPDALHSINRMDMLPFHMAAVHQAPLDVLFYLACQYPEALLCYSGDLVHSDNDQKMPEVQVEKKRKYSFESLQA